jgi:hypothetical protein
LIGRSRPPAPRHSLRKEISEQPQAWIDTLSGRASAGSAEVRFENDLMPARDRNRLVAS